MKKQEIEHRGVKAVVKQKQVYNTIGRSFFRCVFGGVALAVLLGLPIGGARLGVRSVENARPRVYEAKQQELLAADQNYFSRLVAAGLNIEENRDDFINHPNLVEARHNAALLYVNDVSNSRRPAVLGMVNGTAISGAIALGLAAAWDSEKLTVIPDAIGDTVDNLIDIVNNRYNNKQKEKAIKKIDKDLDDGKSM